MRRKQGKPGPGVLRQAALLAAAAALLLLAYGCAGGFARGPVYLPQRNVVLFPSG